MHHAYFGTIYPSELWYNMGGKAWLDSAAIPVYREQSWSGWTQQQHSQWRGFLINVKNGNHPPAL